MAKNLEAVEKELDLKIYEEVMTEHKANPITYTHAEMRTRLGLDNYELNKAYADYAKDEEQQAENKLWDCTVGDGLEQPDLPLGFVRDILASRTQESEPFEFRKAKLMKKLVDYDGDYEPEDVWSESVGEEVL